MTNKVLRVEEVTPPQSVQQKLKLKDDVPVYLLERIVYVNDDIL
ncbi:UTRA domain-containing protein, partial [Staphylococcus aureus]